MQKVVSVLLGLAAVAALAAAAGATTGGAVATAASACRTGQITPAYAGSVRRALTAGKDVWGDAMLGSPAGPTYKGAARRLKPLLLAAGPRRRLLTDSGVYYIPFGWPTQFGAQSVALHVADGSAVLANRTSGPKLTVAVGIHARERYGSCLSRLPTPQLADGYLPILDTKYVDAGGVRYRQESFAVVLPELRSLVSFVRLSADATRSDHTVWLRFTPSTRGLRMSDDGSLLRGRMPFLFASEGANFDGSSLLYQVPAGTGATVYVAWPIQPAAAEPFVLDEGSYARARDAVAAFWSARLASGATFEVPEQRVQNAAQNLLIQNLTLAWRYSVGDRYNTKLSTPEAIDGAGVMGEYGFRELNQAILDASFWRRLRLTTNWRIGEQLLGSARYWTLFHDSPYLEARTPRLVRYVAHVRRQLLGRSRSLLRRERYSSDVYADVFGLHAQAVVWDGLRAMRSVWARTGHPELAARAGAVASRLESGLRHALGRSVRRLDDGSLFVPIQLFDGEVPYKRLTTDRLGSYWNLVVPYALASGILPPRSAGANGVLKYMLAHGSRILGLVRADAFTLYRHQRFPKSGTDQVYGLNVSRFLADNDRPDQLVLSLYGQLAAGMTRGTYISGEAATVAPLRGEYYRRMFLPPNSGSNSAFLETLRLMLVHERRGGDGAARGLELAFATPRAWLKPGRQIVVDGAPTSFGALSYSLSATEQSVHAELEVPADGHLRTVKLRLRLPRGERLKSVLIDGRRHTRFDPATGTIDLSGRTGSVSLEARY
jgi:hypothetical protein